MTDSAQGRAVTPLAHAAGSNRSKLLAQAIRTELSRQADSPLASPMRAYMKSALPFHGLPAPLRPQLVKAAAAALPLADEPTLCDAVLQMRRDASHREQRYAALGLLRLPRHQRLANLQWLPVLQEFIATGPWRDHKDEISGLSLSLLLQRHPEQVKPLLRQWAQGPELWFRRASMLAQRSLVTDQSDAQLLVDCILPSLAPDPLASEFYIRKGMGWALRERSHAAPDEVGVFCVQHHARLSALARTGGVLWQAGAGGHRGPAQRPAHHRRCRGRAQLSGRQAGGLPPRGRLAGRRPRRPAKARPPAWSKPRT